RSASVCQRARDPPGRCASLRDGLRPSWTVTARAGGACAGRDERMVAIQSNQRMKLAQGDNSDGDVRPAEKPVIHFQRRGGKIRGRNDTKIIRYLITIGVPF